MYSTNMNTRFTQFVEWVGGPKRAAHALDKSESLIHHVMQGRRNVSRDVANRVHEISNGRFDRADLFFEGRAQ